MKRRTLMLAGMLLFAPTRALAQRVPVVQIAGTWSSADWGSIELHADGTGTYTSMYGTGVGRVTLHPAGPRRFSGTWGESAQRHGTLSLELSADGRTLHGTWTPDPSCTIGTMTGGVAEWRRG